MGQAKQRGNYDERKALAIDHNRKSHAVMTELVRRRPSPKHTALMCMIAELVKEE